jgi:predicted site-specific integrase-resolvase
MSKPKEQNVVLLSREETRQFLRTSFPTLRKWTREGLLKCYGLGSRIYYKKHEILKALQTKNTDL